MSAVEPDATEGAETSDRRLAGVLRLTVALSDRVLDAQIMKRPVPKQQIEALANAALLLHDHDVPWPPMLAQVLHEMAQTEAELDAGSKVGGIKRFLGAWRGDRGES